MGPVAFTDYTCLHGFALGLTYWSDAGPEVLPAEAVELGREIVRHYTTGDHPFRGMERLLDLEWSGPVPNNGLSELMLRLPFVPLQGLDICLVLKLADSLGKLDPTLRHTLLCRVSGDFEASLFAAGSPRQPAPLDPPESELTGPRARSFFERLTYRRAFANRALLCAMARGERPFPPIGRQAEVELVFEDGRTETRKATIYPDTPLLEYFLRNCGLSGLSEARVLKESKDRHAERTRLQRSMSVMAWASHFEQAPVDPRWFEELKQVVSKTRDPIGQLIGLTPLAKLPPLLEAIETACEEWRHHSRYGRVPIEHLEEAKQLLELLG